MSCLRVSPQRLKIKNTSNNIVYYYSKFTLKEVLSPKEEKILTTELYNLKQAIIVSVFKNPETRREFSSFLKSVINGDEKISYILYYQGEKQRNKKMSIDVLKNIVETMDKEYKYEKCRIKRLMFLLLSIHISFNKIFSIFKKCQVEKDLCDKFEKIKTELTERNIKLVLSVSRKFSGHHILDDIVQQGVLGLMYAIEEYDPYRNCKLSTLAYYWIRHYLLRYLTYNASVVRNSAYHQTKITSLNKKIRKAEVDLCRPLTKSEISDIAAMSIESYDKICIARFPDRSLECRYDEKHNSASGSEFTSLMYMEDKKQKTPEEICINKNMIKILSSAISRLTPKEQKVIRLCYGIYPELGEKTYVEVASEVDMTARGVSTVHNRAIDKIRDKKEFKD